MMSVNELLRGDDAPLFWFAAVGCGLLAPLAIAILHYDNLRGGIIAVSSLSIIVGGFVLRLAIINSCYHITQLMMPV